MCVNEEQDCTMSQEEIETLLEYVDENSVDAKFKGIAGEIVEMLVKKNNDYGDENLIRRGLLGIIVRMEDKISRLDNLRTKEAEVDESIEDTLKDIAGYAINAIRLLRENKI